jgi:hypothetical protein
MDNRCQLPNVTIWRYGFRQTDRHANFIKREMAENERKKEAARIYGDLAQVS